MKDNENKKENIITSFLKKITSKPTVLQDIKRPKDIPIYAPDCGWNHGEPKEK